MRSSNQSVSSNHPFAPTPDSNEMFSSAGMKNHMPEDREIIEEEDDE